MPRLASANGTLMDREEPHLSLRVVAGKVLSTGKHWSVRMITILRAITLIHPIAYLGGDMRLLPKRQLNRRIWEIVRETKHLFLCFDRTGTMEGTSGTGR